MSEKYTFFFGASSPFSQHHISNFKIDGRTFSSAEQYMMHQKALLFGDEECAEKILNSENPEEMKKFGRQVRNFNAEIWNANCEDIVKKANIAKFSQNPSLKKALLATSGSVLVEASPFDKKWGIGMEASNPKAKQKETWSGQNLLGHILTDVRDNELDDDINTTS